jgi:Flp pilus assembly protein TadD
VESAAPSPADDRARYWMLVGWYALDRGDRDGARSAFARAAALDPSAAAPRAALASLSAEPVP